VTAVDISAVALDRGAYQADQAGQGIAERITWQREDILSWQPPAQQFDLVSVQFMQLPQAELQALHARLAAAVRPGGSLLVVGHHPSDLETSVHRPHHPELMFTAEQVAAKLDPQIWTIQVAAARPREVVDPDGQPVTIQDAVLHAVRGG
jgi:SAM-dependent methyltransferase